MFVRTQSLAEGYFFKPLTLQTKMEIRKLNNKFIFTILNIT